MNLKKVLIRISFFLFLSGFLAYSISSYGDIGGRTGRTKKSSNNGCGGCHGSSATTGVSVSISGPSSVVTGQTAQFSMTITRAGMTGAGIDIATRRGTLAAVSSGTRLQSGEITHNDNLAMSGGTITVLFNYTAPATSGVDTIWSTGNATNSNGGEDGDQWNWSGVKHISVITPPKTLTLTAMPEGFYNPGTNTMVSDTATVYLRNATSPYAIVNQAKSLLNSSGVGTFTFNSASNSVPYYIVVVHRNSIETWSASGQSFISNSMNYNFTTSATQAYGNNLSLVGTKWTIFSGDVNQDGVVDGSDAGLIDNDAFNFVSGYVVTDLNYDDIVDASDASLADNNAFNFVGTIRP